MLRFLIFQLIFWPSIIFAENSEYSEPSSDAVNDTKHAIGDALNQVDKLLKADSFLQEVEDQKRDLKMIPNNGVQSTFNFDSVNPELKEDRFVSKALAAGQKVYSNKQQEAWTNAPIVMVSFSMPESAIKSLMLEAAKIGANVVIRGPQDGDLLKTIQRVQRLTSETGMGGVQIDPTLFKRFQVTSVPSFVLPIEPVRTCDHNGCPGTKHVKAHGSSTIRYFLEKASRLGDDKEKEVAESWLALYDQKVGG